jgi:hypothetical protein
LQISYTPLMFWKKPTAVIISSALLLVPAISTYGADVKVLSKDDGKEVYTGVKFLGTTPLLIEDCRPGEMTLSLAGGPDFSIEVPDDDRTVTVFLNVEPKTGMGLLGKTGRWILVGGIVGGIAAIVYLASTREGTE